MFSGTVRAGLGLRAATVPLATGGLAERLLRPDWKVVETVRFRASSDSIFLRIACGGSARKMTREETDLVAL